MVDGLTFGGLFKNVVIVSTNGVSYSGFVDFRDDIETPHTKVIF